MVRFFYGAPRTPTSSTSRRSRRSAARSLTPASRRRWAACSTKAWASTSATGEMADFEAYCAAAADDRRGQRAVTDVHGVDESRIHHDEFTISADAAERSESDMTEPEAPIRRFEGERSSRRDDRTARSSGPAQAPPRLALRGRDDRQPAVNPTGTWATANRRCSSRTAAACGKPIPRSPPLGPGHLPRPGDNGTHLLPAGHRRREAHGGRDRRRAPRAPSRRLHARLDRVPAPHICRCRPSWSTGSGSRSPPQGATASRTPSPTAWCSTRR